MYDDRYQGANGDCKTPHAAGCWGHRDNILGRYPKATRFTAARAGAPPTRKAQRPTVLVMGAGSTMELCMEYTNYDANKSFSGPAPIYAFQWPACYDSCAGPPANNVSTSASPQNISLSAGQSNVVEYTIAAGKNSTGFVGLSLGPVSYTHLRSRVQTR